ncbi:MAG: DUF5946 family protein [Chloroflexota bacterium]|nr:hypothetical protein [Chloroflexia bacterium]MDQ3225262.1 DUF5946 family protein [Chloroflexota bacterium]
MGCQECGADVPDAETCLDYFHALFAAEVDNDELRRMHGLTLLTYNLQHPSLSKPWYQLFGAEVMRRVFVRGENWSDALMETHPRGVGRQQADAAVARLKTGGPSVMPDWVITRPVPGELTVTCVDLASVESQGDMVTAWARSVAAHRYLGRERDQI